jgi:MTH538 TIR-like domain (DUF1863)
MANRVFFSFHYQDVIDFRVNVVRNHNVLKTGNGGYFDASIWESSKKQGNTALKRLINNEIQNTTVTAVLIGSQTYARKWVHYEIFKSLERQNKVVGIHINAVPCKNKLIKFNGPNPFDQIGLEISSNGEKGTPTVFNGEKWVYFTEVESFRIGKQSNDRWGKNFQLSTWLKTYCWINDFGYTNFDNWIK